MRIGLDFRPAQKTNSRRRGIGKYTEQLTRALLDSNPGHEVILYTRKGSTFELTGSFQARELFFLNRPGRLNWLVDCLLLPRNLRRDRIELFHCTEALSLPSEQKCKTVATVHDLIPLVFWEETIGSVPPDFRWALQRSWRNLHEVDGIITVSNFSADDIASRLSLSRELIHVIYPGSNPVLQAVDVSRARALVRDNYGVNHPYLLYVGGTDFRKNLPRLIDFFATIRKKGFKGDLILAGETFQFSIPEVQNLRARIVRLGLEESVKLPGYVSDEHLSWFYSGAVCFIFPSLYEGFGLPLLEAMKCGTPALVSRASCLPEIGGDAPLYFDPVDVGSMVDAFFQFYQSSHLPEQMCARGKARARNFSWKRAAGETYQLYDRLIGGRR